MRRVPIVDSFIKLAIFNACLALSACATVGTDYKNPESQAPQRWNSSTAQEPAAEAELASWWTQFNDPLLNELVDEVLKSNLDLATAQARLDEARARRSLAGSQLGPSVDASVSGSRSKASSESSTGTTRELYSAGLDASWEIDVFGRMRRGVQASQADLDSVAESLINTRISLIAEVVLNYVDLRVAERRLAVANDGLMTRSETYDLAQWRLEAGLASDLDVAQARTELDSAKAAIPSLQTLIAEAQHRLAVLSGRAPGELIQRLQTSTSALSAPTRATATGIPADTLRRRPDVRAAERRLAAQTARLAEAQVVADAGASPSKFGDDMALRRMEKNGATLTSTNQVIAELAGNWATPEGTQIVTEVVMPALQG